MLVKCLCKHREPLSPITSEKPEQRKHFDPRKKMNGNIVVELFLSDLDKKMTSASKKREQNKNKVALCEANNLLNLFTACPLSRTG